MHILVLLRMVPDVVEELEVDAGGKALDAEFLRMILSETDDHALEQALLVKERSGGTVTAVGLDAAEMEDALYSALAKGADRAIIITDAGAGGSTRRAAEAFVQFTAEAGPSDLILTGTQTIDDLDGLVGPLVAHALEMPYLGTVTAVQPDTVAGKAVVVREYADAVRGEFEIPFPAVLGIQAAEKPPRYVPVAKVRAVRKSQKVDTFRARPAGSRQTWLEVVGMAKPEPATHAEMLEGDPEQVAETVAARLAARGLI